MAKSNEPYIINYTKYTLINLLNTIILIFLNTYTFINLIIIKET